MSAPTGEAEELASGKLILDEPAPGVARLRIDNASRRGALDHEILDTLAETVRGLSARCLLLTGTGEMFSAGYDLRGFGEQDLSAAAEKLVAHPFHEALEALEGYPFPVVGALNGHAIGGGLELALTCDIRLGAEGIRVGMSPAKLGLVYSHTGLRKFLELCGPAHTAELFYGAENVDAARAERIGLLNHVVPAAELEARALELAARIAGNAPLSVAGNKRIMRSLRRAEGALPEAEERELVRLREACFRTEDFHEGVRAFAEKRAPRWQGR